MPTAIEIISSLHTKITDTAKGYEDAMKIGNHERVATLCADLRKQHLTHAHDLAGLLLERGERPDGDGSFMSLVQKAALNARFVISADETTMLPSLRENEKRLLEAYDDTLRECEINGTFSADEVSTLQKQREDVVANVGKVDALQSALNADHMVKS